MHRSTLFAALPLFLLACTSTDAARSRQRELQVLRERQHLAELFGAAATDDAGHLPAPTGAAPQQPAAPSAPARHIDDQREVGTASPQEPAKERPYGHRPADRFDTELGMGIGTFGLRVPGTRLDDTTSAVFLRGSIEPAPSRAVGAGFQLEGMVSDNALFAGAVINDGVQPVHGEAQAWSLDAFPHAVLDPLAGGDVGLPIRLGLFFDYLRVTHEHADVQREFLSFGPRLQVEPEWHLLGRGGTDLGLFAHLGTDGGATWFKDGFANGSDSDSTGRWAAECGGGLHLRRGPLFGELSYRFQYVHYYGIDTDLLGDRGKVETRSQMVFLGAGLHF